MPRGASAFLLLWYTYGADESERVKRVVIAVGALVVLGVGIAIALSLLPLPPSGDTALAEALAARFRPRDFAYVMTILTALAAATCTAFFGVFVSRSSEHDGPDHDARWAMTALMISLVATIAATMSFAGLYASGSEGQPTSHRLIEFHMLVLAFLQLSISLALVSVTIIPTVSNRPGPILGSVVSAISAFWWVPAGWILFFLLAMPEIGHSVMATFCVLLFLTMAQIYYPHGWHRMHHPKAYERTLLGLMFLSYFVLGGCVIAAELLVVADILWAPVNPDYFAVTICGLFLVVGAALWCYSTSTEGRRKFRRYSGIEDGQFVRREGA